MKCSKWKEGKKESRQVYWPCTDGSGQSLGAGVISPAHSGRLGIQAQVGRLRTQTVSFGGLIGNICLDFKSGGQKQERFSIHGFETTASNDDDDYHHQSLVHTGLN